MADDFVLVPVVDPLIGAEFGSFVIVRRLGCGGMGAVYLAQHKAAPLVRRVLKTMLAHLANHPLMIERFNTEALAVGKLRHDNIVELNDFGVLPTGQLYLDFEYIDGIPLDQFLAEHGGRLSLHRAVYLVFQVCDALDHAHAEGVVHRDLKPDNLLITIDDEKRVPRFVKLVDFGISKVVRTGGIQTLSGLSMGTPYFMSVEQYSNAAEASNKSDVYSLAIILWLMVTGELPWGRPDPTVLYHLQQTVVPTTPPRDVMPPAVSRILLRCFSTNPDDRPTMRELAVELAAVIAATDDAPSGGAILQHIARRFLTSAPYHARTVPHAAPANPDGVAAQLWPPTGKPATSADEPALTAEPPVPAVLSAQARPVTVHDSPRARAASAAASDGAAVPEPLPTDVPATSAALASALPGSVFAAFPTGLISQRHLAAEQSPDARTGMPRVRSIVAAAEIDVRVAQGTPGPQPYAHAELPPVVLSTTQLSAAPRQRALAAESSPILLLPQSAQPRTRRALVAISVAAGMLVVVAVVSAIQLRKPPREEQTIQTSGADPERTHAASTVASVAVVDAGIIDATPHHAALAPDAEPSDATGVVSSSTVASGSGTSAGSSAATPARAAQPSPDEQVPVVRHDDAIAPRVPSRSNSVAASARPPAKPVDRQTEAVPIRSISSQSEHPQPVDDGEHGRRGTIIVRVPQTWAQVWIDQVDSGTTPVRENVPVGPHKVLLVGASHRETVSVTVTAGGESVIERNW